MPSPFHRGDYHRVRRSVTIAVLELEVLEPRMQIAYKRGLLPPECVANLSLARLMAQELEALLRQALDYDIADTGRYADVYLDSTYTRRGLVEARPIDEEKIA